MCVQYFLTRREIRDARFDTHGVRDTCRQFVQRVWLVGADVEDVVPGCWDFDRFRDDWRDVIDVAEGSRLRAVAEDGHWLGSQNLIHEYADNVAVAVGDILTGTEDVVRAEDDEVEVEHVAAGVQFLLDGKFCNA